MCALQMLQNAGLGEDQCPEVNLGTKSILAGRDAAALLTLHGAVMSCPWLMLLWAPAKAGKTLICCLASTGMDRAGMHREMENSASTTRAFQKCVLHCRAAVRVWETADLKRRGKSWERKLSTTSAQPSSTPVASSSFRDLCRHHNQDPENFTWFISSLTRMKCAHGKKNTEIISQSTPQASMFSCKTCCKNYCCQFHDHQPSFLSQRKIKSKTAPRWLSGWEETFPGSTICPDLREYKSRGFRHTLLSSRCAKQTPS